MAKAQKIDALKQRIKTLEADIAEFVNEFGKAKIQSSKKSGFGSHITKTLNQSNNVNST